MKKCFNRFSFVMLIALVLLVAPGAQAAVQLTLQSGATTVTINDGDANDGNPLAGVITYIGTVGAEWVLNVTTGSIFSAPNPLIDLNSVNGNVAAGTLALTFSGTNFAGPVPSFEAKIGGTLAGGHSLTYEAWVNSNNTLNAMQTSIGGAQNFGPGPAAFSGVVGGGSAGMGLYSLTQQVVITATAAGTSSFDAAVFPVPEPASVALFGGVLMLTGLAIRRRAKSNV